LIEINFPELPVAQFLSKELLASYKRFSKQLFHDCNISAKHGDTPIQVRFIKTKNSVWVTNFLFSVPGTSIWQR